MRRIHDYLRRGAALTVAAAALASGCKDEPRWSEEQGELTRTWKPAPTAVRGIAPEALQSAITARLDEERPPSVSAEQWKRVRQLYDAYDATPLWLEEQGARDRTKALISEVTKAPTHGLSLASYPVTELQQALRTVRDAGTPTAEQLAAADILLSATYVTLAHDLLTGQLNPRAESQNWHVDPHTADIDSALVQRIQFEPLDRAIAQLKPADADYDALREQLVRYRELVSAGGWGTVPQGAPLKPGDTASASRLTALEGRLRVEGYLPEGVTVVPMADSSRPGERAVYDAAAAGAVAQFQARHGIVVDSILGDETVASLNLPADYRLAQIAANLERFRWLPRSFGMRYILVNVPAFQLTAYDSGGKALEMKVIVGQEYENKATPVFADSMESVVFRPYWNITPDIQANETAPKIAADPGYMAANNLEYFRDGGERRIRQKPGPKNSLGLVKFLFPNDFNIYLHDTPEKELFDKDVRAFSHGCIRVEKPVQLAAWVLGWDENKVREAEQGKDNNWVRLRRKLPVYIVYFTTYVRDGQLYFGNDLYDRDSALMKDMGTRTASDAEPLRALEAIQQLVGT